MTARPASPDELGRQQRMAPHLPVPRKRPGKAKRVPVNRRRAWFAALVVIVLAGGFLVYRYGTKHVALTGIQFDVPFSWSVNDTSRKSMAPVSTLALVGTLPWGDCAESDINCHYRERLSRHEIEIEISLAGMRGTDFCTFARERPDLAARGDGIRVSETHYFRIDNRPAISVDFSFDTDAYREADGWREWMIATGDGTTAQYRIFAKWRGPGDDEFTAALDRLVASIKLGPSGYAVAGGADCGDPFPPAS